MARVKVKFRPSTLEGEKGTIYYQVIQHRIVRQKKTNYHLYTHEWNFSVSEIIFPENNHERYPYLMDIAQKIRHDLSCFQQMIEILERQKEIYTADELVYFFTEGHSKHYFIEFMQTTIMQLKAWGKIRTSETYTATLNSFKRFRRNQDVALCDFSEDLMMEYQKYLRKNDICPNTISFYMRNLRAVYNKAVEKGIITQSFPFRRVYTGIEKTIKRAIPLSVVKRIKRMDLSSKPSKEWARDMFLFSFYTRGMSFIDMAYLKKKDLQHGMLTYRRCKTGQQLIIKWEACMQILVDKYDTGDSPFLLPIIQPSIKDERKQYIYALHNINRNLKILGTELGLSIPLTMYVARHTWASIAKSNHVPLSVISEGMGHDSETTTQIYLTTLDTMAVDRANKRILNLL